MGRYEPLLKIASGGMATVLIGARRGPFGFTNLVAIKRPHPHLLDDPGFKATLLAEANVASSLHHANVVSVRDLEEIDGAPALVMDYVEGASLGQLILRAAKDGPALPLPVAVRIVLDASRGLGALHALVDAKGAPLGFVHRDVSPQNILVGLDGVTRIADFGLAKCARGSEQPTTQGTLKGKLGYLAPEMLSGRALDRRADVFQMGIVLFEALSKKRLFRGENDADTLEQVAKAPIPVPSAYNDAVSAELDGVVARALERSLEGRFQNIEAFAEELERAQAPAGAAEVARHVAETFGGELAERRKAIEKSGRASTPSMAATTPPAPKLTLNARWTRWAILGGAVVIGGALYLASQKPASVLMPAPLPAPPAPTTTIAVPIPSAPERPVAAPIARPALRPGRRATSAPKLPPPNPYH